MLNLKRMSEEHIRFRKCF